MIPNVADVHVRELEIESGIAAHVIVRARLYSESNPKALAKLTGRSKKMWTPETLPALVFPYFQPGDPDPHTFVNVKPRTPIVNDDVDEDGNPTRLKYVRPPKESPPPYLPPDLLEDPVRLGDRAVPKLITEGEKKALSASSRGFACIALSGVDCFGPKRESRRAQKRLHPILAAVAKSGAEIFITYDTDRTRNRNIRKAEKRLAEALFRAGARSVFLVRLPDVYDDDRKTGLDDFLAVRGQRGADELLALMDEARRVGPVKIEGVRVADLSLPRVDLGADEERVNTEAIAILAGAREDVYQRAGELVTVTSGAAAPKGIAREALTPMIRRVDVPRLREILSACISWHDHGTEEPQHPPGWAVSGILARGDWPGVRPLTAVVEHPVLLPDGLVLDEAGYHADTGLLLRPAIEYPKIPTRPTARDVAAAIAALDNVICDFSWDTPGDRAGWYAAALTPLTRFAYDGPAPLTLFEASTAGSGKSLGASIAGIIGTGREPARATFSADEAEMDKRVLSVAMAGDRIAVLDNIITPLGGAPLCNALTATHYEGRILGLNAKWRGPLLATWYATGNNVALGEDMARRVYRARIVASQERPEEREGFRHPRLLSYVRDHRASLTTAALTLLRAYAAAGAPDQRLSPWGSYEAWSACVRSTLAWAQIGDPGETRIEVRSATDMQTETVRDLIHGWAELAVKLNAGNPISAARAIAALWPTEGEPASGALRDAVEALLGLRANERPNAKRLGKLLARHRGRIVAGRMLTGTANRDGTVEWVAGFAGSGGVSEEPSRARLSLSKNGNGAHCAYDGTAHGGQETPRQPANPAGGLEPGAWDEPDPFDAEAAQ